MLLEMSLPLLSRLRAVSLLLNLFKSVGEWNIWVPRAACCAGACTSVLTPVQHWRCWRLCCSNTQISHSLTDFRTRAVWNKKETARRLFAVRPQTNQRFYIKIFLFNYVYLRVTGTARKLVLGHIIILLGRMQTKVTLKLPKVCKHICLVVQWQGHPTIIFGKLSVRKAILDL